MDQNGGGDGAGGGAGGGDGKGGKGEGAAGSVTLSKEQFDAIMARLPKETKKEGEGGDDPSLAEKAKREAEQKENQKKRDKSLEVAVQFSQSAKDFVKSNKGLLPDSIEGIFAQAEKETFESAIEKSNAIKVDIVKEFFGVQSNMDLLTGHQKNQLDDFLKLTNTMKQERVENVYAMIFEPTLETLRKIEKAKQINSGSKNQTDSEKALSERLMKLSKKHYLGEKDA